MNNSGRHFGMLARFKSSWVSILKQDILARLIFSRVKAGPLNLSKIEMLLIG